MTEQLAKEKISSSFKSMRVHHVKSWIELFEPVRQGEKVHELRFNDRNYQVGDILDLQEYDQKRQKQTGRSLKVVITYMTSAANPCAVSDIGMHEGFVILSVKKLSDPKRSKADF